MHTRCLCGLNTRLCVFEHQNTGFTSLEVMLLVELLAHLSQILRPLLSELLSGDMLVGMTAKQTLPCSKKEDVGMRLPTRQPRVVATNDSICKGPKEIRVACRLDFKIPALAAGSNADGNVVFVEVLDETSSSLHLWYLLKRFEENLIAVLEELVNAEWAVWPIQLPFLCGRPYG